jgi:hypothetical protein
VTALERQMAADAIGLHAAAESRWAALRDEIQQERTAQDNLAADHAELGHDDQSGRCYGAVAALDRVMAVMDRMEGEQ